MVTFFLLSRQKIQILFFTALFSSFYLLKFSSPTLLLTKKVFDYMLDFTIINLMFHY